MSTKVGKCNNCLSDNPVFCLEPHALDKCNKVTFPSDIHKWHSQENTGHFSEAIYPHITSYFTPMSVHCPWTALFASYARELHLAPNFSKATTPANVCAEIWCGGSAKGALQVNFTWKLSFFFSIFFSCQQLVALTWRCLLFRDHPILGFQTLSDWGCHMYTACQNGHTGARDRRSLGRSSLF